MKASTDLDEAPELGAEFFERPIVTRPGESLIENVRKARMDITITTETLQDIRDRAAKILDWVNRTIDAGESESLDSGTRNKANAWYYRFALLTSEMWGAESGEEPEQHRKAVARIAKHYLQFIGEFEELETQYERAIGRSAEAANRALNLASGGVDDDGD